MRIIFLSDTHNLHRHYGRPPFGDVPIGDVLVHCGDVTTHGTVEELDTFLDWFERQPHRHKIWIAGNHDRCVENERRNRAGLIYLEEDGVEIEGVKFYGSPYTPDHCDFAFQLHDTAEERWSKIPDDVDVLITHGPPFGVLDVGHGEDHAGCKVLRREVERIRPRIHAFGHLHESYGIEMSNSTIFVNAAVHTWLWKSDRRRDPVGVNVL